MDNKFVVVLSKKIEVGRVLNATAHMCASLVAKARSEEREQMQFLDYIDASGEVHKVSGLSLIVLRADNSNKLRKFRREVIANDLTYVDFLESMTGGTTVEQIERTAETLAEELNYFGVAVFGSASKINPLTRKFSLWR